MRWKSASLFPPRGLTDLIGWIKKSQTLFRGVHIVTSPLSNIKLSSEIEIMAMKTPSERDGYDVENTGLL